VGKTRACSLLRPSSLTSPTARHVRFCQQQAGPITPCFARATKSLSHSPWPFNPGESWEETFSGSGHLHYWWRTPRGRHGGQGGLWSESRGLLPSCSLGGELSSEPVITGLFRSCGRLALGPKAAGYFCNRCRNFSMRRPDQLFSLSVLPSFGAAPKLLLRIAPMVASSSRQLRGLPMEAAIVVNAERT